MLLLQAVGFVFVKLALVKDRAEFTVTVMGAVAGLLQVPLTHAP